MILVGKPERKRALGRPKRRWVDNTKMGLRAIGWDGMEWTNLAQDGDCCEHELSSSIKVQEILEWRHHCQLLKKGSAAWN
jgi:hypothetical protein